MYTRVKTLHRAYLISHNIIMMYNITFYIETSLFATPLGQLIAFNNEQFKYMMYVNIHVHKSAYTR